MSGAHDEAAGEIGGLHKDVGEGLPAPDARPEWHIERGDSVGAGSLRVFSSFYLSRKVLFPFAVVRFYSSEEGGKPMEWQQEEEIMALDDLETDMGRQVDLDGDSGIGDLESVKYVSRLILFGQEGRGECVERG
jgi:hypothetical protein